MILSNNIQKYKRLLKNKPGVYMIRNVYNGKRYIGSTGDLFYRLKSHKNKLLINKHSNKHLQYAINKYGIDCFDFQILKFVQLCEQYCLIKYEQYYIDFFKPEYNIQPFAYLNRGYKHTKEAIEKIRLSGIGRKTNNKEVLQFDLKGNFIREWSSMMEVKRILCINNTNLCKVCKNYESNGIIYPYYHSAHGFIWKYKKKGGMSN